MDAEQRLNNLEIRYTHMEELVNELNLIVAKQQIIIEDLQREVLTLVQSNSKSDVQGNRTLKDDIPPHY
mgnify:CR=1 FL=1